jgi:hypothetical protein
MQPSLLAALTLTKKHPSTPQRIVQADDCSEVLFLLRPVGSADKSGAGAFRASANASVASRITGCAIEQKRMIVLVPIRRNRKQRNGPCNETANRIVGAVQESTAPSSQARASSRGQASARPQPAPEFEDHCPT